MHPAWKSAHKHTHKLISCSNTNKLYLVPSKQQTFSCLRTFAHAVSFVCNILISSNLPLSLLALPTSSGHAQTKSSKFWFFFKTYLLEILKCFSISPPTNCHSSDLTPIFCSLNCLILFRLYNLFQRYDFIFIYSSLFFFLYTIFNKLFVLKQF